MPLREFICERGHVTELILHGADDRTRMLAPCGHARCKFAGKRVEISRPAEPKLIGEGFYKPSASGKES